MVMTVFFFGGYNSTHNDVVSWKNSFEKKTNLPAMVFHYPEGASAGDPLEDWDASEDVAQLVKDGDTIVGHSSGCAIANDVAETVLKIKAKTEGIIFAKRFKLIVLDGFHPRNGLRDAVDTKIWSAKCGDVYSLNYHALKDFKNFHVYEAKVKEKWPLHFSLVNLNVSDEYGLITQGYHDCDANLEVLGLTGV